MITIDQLLESVDLDFEPRFVTKDPNGTITVWDKEPYLDEYEWLSKEQNYFVRIIGRIKLSEFDGKDWTECIYEVPRKEEPKDKIKIGILYIDKNVTFGDGDDDDMGVALEDYEVPRKTTGKIERFTLDDFVTVVDVENCVRSVLDSRVFNKLNGLVDMVNNIISVQEKMIDSRFVVNAVNELKGAKND